MTDQGKSSDKKGFIARLWNFLWRPTRASRWRRSSSRGVAGIVFWGGFNWRWKSPIPRPSASRAMKCATIPTRNCRAPSISRTAPACAATCPDCQRPASVIWKMKRKIEASNEVLHQNPRPRSTRREIRGASLRARQARLGRDVVDGFARMPQLPSEIRWIRPSRSRRRPRKCRKASPRA